MKKIPPWFVGKWFGAFLLVFFGCGSVGAAVTTARRWVCFR